MQGHSVLALEFTISVHPIHLFKCAHKRIIRDAGLFRPMVRAVSSFQSQSKRQLNVLQP